MRLEHNPEDGCGDCPLIFAPLDKYGNLDYSGHRCGAAPGRTLGEHLSTDSAPPWCPLRTESVTVAKPHPMQALANKITAEHFPGMPAPRFVPRGEDE